MVTRHLYWILIGPPFAVCHLTTLLIGVKQDVNNSYTVFCFVSDSSKCDICTVVGLNRTLVEAKMVTFTLE
jgi:hypothetical protein